MINIGLEKVIGTILSAVSKPLGKKLQRTEVVVRVLRDLGLDPEHPPADFSGVYAYALVEYGADDKPRELLDLFRRQEISNAFRTAYDRDDFSILEKEASRFLDWNRLGDDLQALSIDARREFIVFRTCFEAIVNRSRLPKETATHYKIEMIHETVQEMICRPFSRQSASSE